MNIDRAKLMDYTAWTFILGLSTACLLGTAGFFAFLFWRTFLT